MHKSPHHRSIKQGTPRVFGTDNSLLLAETRQVLTTDIDGEMAEPARDLCRYLLVGLETLIPQTIDRCRHASTAV